MLDPRYVDEDVRLQRLADLSIEIRMLKAHAAVTAPRVDTGASNPTDNVLAFRTAANGARCPYCGHTAGLALLPREYRRLSTLVRCFSCERDAVAFDWFDRPGEGLDAAASDFR
jgi:hypothetical protein